MADDFNDPENPMTAHHYCKQRIADLKAGHHVVVPQRWANEKVGGQTVWEALWEYKCCVHPCGQLTLSKFTAETFKPKTAESVASVSPSSSVTFQIRNNIVLPISLPDYKSLAPLKDWPPIYARAETTRDRPPHATNHPDATFHRDARRLESGTIHIPKNVRVIRAADVLYDACQATLLFLDELYSSHFADIDKQIELRAKVAVAIHEADGFTESKK